MGHRRRGLSWGRAGARSAAVTLSVLLVVAVAGLAGVPAAGGQGGSAKLDPGLAGLAGSSVSVVVQAWPGRAAEAKAAAVRAGLTVGVDLVVIDGFEARGGVRALRALAGSTAVKAVSMNRKGGYTSAMAGQNNQNNQSNGNSGNGGGGARSSASEFVASTGASLAWAAGNTGVGVGVAVIDTGVSSMNDLSGRVAFGPDLSGEGTTVDSYGHGTVMASLIAGSGADSAANRGGYTGMAPGATVIAVKTAGYNGAADVSTILQAFSWVSAYQAQYHIRVVNLSWGTPSTQDPKIDPLDYAVERLWNSGIVVVVAAGNAGPGARTITKPGDDPLVVTVGAYDDHIGPTLNTIPAWSSRGPTAAGLAKPDVVAPGRTLIAGRSYGSNIEVSNPRSLITPSYITGSGTSEATAVTSGLAALIIAAHPTWTPDQVKTALKTSAEPIWGVGVNDQGAGRVQVAAAIAAKPGPPHSQNPGATGLGSIEASRGGTNVMALCNGVATTITGEIDVRCETWNPAAWTGSAWTGSSWTGSSWTGSSWTAATWTGSSWTGGTWTGSSWTGTAWTGSSWTGSSWTGHRWSGSSWTGSSWTGSTWTGHRWSTLTCPPAATTGKNQTAFWGKQPNQHQHINGEQSSNNNG